MRGYFDGDGCFGISYDELGNIKKYSCSYLSASEKLINANNNDVVYDKAKNLANEVNGIFYITTAKEDKDIKDIIGIAIENYINLP